MEVGGHRVVTFLDKDDAFFPLLWRRLPLLRRRCSVFKMPPFTLLRAAPPGNQEEGHRGADGPGVKGGGRNPFR
jgi:hypothetical protein